MSRELIARARRWAINGQNENALTAVPRSFLNALADAQEQALDELAAAQAREAKYREALEWYADDGNYSSCVPGNLTEWRNDRTPFEPDKGKRARAALKQVTP